MKKVFVYFDEVKAVLPFHKLQVLIDNGDNYSLCSLPINVNGSLNNYQNNVGKIIYLLDEKEDCKFISKNPNLINILEGEEDNYSVVKFYNRNNVSVKKSKIRSVIEDENKQFAIYKNSYNLNYSDELFVLKQNSDNTVSIQNAPLFIKKSMLQYQIDSDSFLVVLYRESLNCDLDDIIELENVGDNKYEVIKIYHDNKVKQMRKK